MSAALLRLEGQAVLRARWFGVTLLLALGIVGFFLVVAARESSVLGFTGFGKVMGGVVQTSLLLVPLLAILATAQAVTAARQSGVLEWYLSQPTSRLDCFRALLLPRLGALVAPLVGVMALLALAAAVLGQPVSGALLVNFTAVLVGQAVAFGGLGIAVSALSRTPEQALLRALGLWMGAAVLLDFVLLGVMLRWELPPAVVFALAALNPMQDGRVAVLATIDPAMGAIGPVGTWALTSLGTTATLAWTLAWPFLLGLGAVVVGGRAFTTRDVL